MSAVQKDDQLGAVGSVLQQNSHGNGQGLLQLEPFELLGSQLQPDAEHVRTGVRYAA